MNWVISELAKYLLFISINWIFPVAVLVAGINWSLQGAGIPFHLAHNSYTYLGLMMIRFATQTSPTVKVATAKNLDMKDKDGSS